MGYLPFKDNSSFLHSLDKEFSLNFPTLRKMTKIQIEKNRTRRGQKCHGLKKT